MCSIRRPSGRQTIGLLARRHVRIGDVHLSAKNRTSSKKSEEGSIHDSQDVYTKYPDARRERQEWLRDIVPKLKAIPLPELQRLTGLSHATLQAARRGRTPHPRNRAIIVEAIVRRQQMTMIDLALSSRFDDTE